MEKYVTIIRDSFQGYAQYLWQEIRMPHGTNYFYWLIGLSLFVWLLEILTPWRKKQQAFRRDFWLDGFYMFFNFFLFSLIGYNAISNVFVELFNDAIALLGCTNIVALKIASWPVWMQLLALLITRDFLQWNIHRLLHRVPWLWEFHKVHHSVAEMGFAAHLRYHWMETIVYRSLEYLPLAMIGFGIDDFFVVYIFTLLIGHLNHANIHLPLGPLKYILNNPQMHIWHHAYHLPDNRRYGVNFGITFSIWDYLFGTDYIPENGRDIPLGFEKSEEFPDSFWGQIFYGFRR